MSKEKVEENKKIMYLRDEMHLTFREISLVLSRGNRPISESVVARVYRREKTKQEYLDNGGTIEDLPINPSEKEEIK